MKPSIWQALKGAKLVNGKIVLITGAAAGIGKACALIFANQGGRLALVDLQEEGLKKVCQEIQAQGGQAIPIVADVTQPKDIDRIFQVIWDGYRGLDIVVNNAGGGLPTDFFDITFEEWHRMLSLNLTSLPCHFFEEGL